MGDYMYLARGLLIGLIFGVPAGVIGIMTIQRTLEHGFLAGVVTGFGSVAADLVYGCIGVCGMTAVSDALMSRERLIRLLGGILIAAFGMATFRKTAAEREPEIPDRQAHEKGRSRRKPIQKTQRYSLLFGSSFLVAIANPATILAFITAFAAFGILGGVTARQGCYLLCGLALGTGSWWIFLAGLASIFRRKISGRIYGVLNKVLGSLIVLFGIGAAAGGIL